MPNVAIALKILKNKKNLQGFFLSLSHEDLFIKDNGSVAKAIFLGAFESDGVDAEGILEFFKDQISVDFLKDIIVENIYSGQSNQKKIANIKAILKHSRAEDLFEDYLFCSNKPNVNEMLKEEVLKDFEYKIKKTTFEISKLAELARNMSIESQYNNGVAFTNNLSFIKCRVYATFYNDFLNKIQKISEFKKLKEESTELISKTHWAPTINVDYFKSTNMLLMLLTAEPKKEIIAVFKSWLMEDMEVLGFFISNLRWIKDEGSGLIQSGIKIAKNNLKKFKIPANKREDVCLKILEAGEHLTLSEFIDLSNASYQSFRSKLNLEYGKPRIVVSQLVEENIEEDISKSVHGASIDILNTIIRTYGAYNGIDDNDRNLLIEELSRPQYSLLLDLNIPHNHFSDFANLFTLIKALNSKQLREKYEDYIRQQIENIGDMYITQEKAKIILKIIYNYTIVFKDTKLINSPKFKDIYLDTYSKYRSDYINNVPLYYVMTEYIGEEVIGWIEKSNWKQVLLKNKVPNIIKSIILGDSSTAPLLLLFLKDLILPDKQLSAAYLNKSTVNKIKKTKSSEVLDLLDKFELSSRLNCVLDKAISKEKGKDSGGLDDMANNRLCEEGIAPIKAASQSRLLKI